DRARGRVDGVESPFGTMPRYEDINWTGLDYDPKTFYELMSVDRAEGKIEIEDQKKHFDKFGSRLPKELEAQRQQQSKRLDDAPALWELDK
ncbi:MAG: phosphoenolpyruvate carboxykinase domain-containing protein, partial [Rhodospirillales bacterium]